MRTFGAREEASARSLLKSWIAVHSPSCNAAPLRGRGSAPALEPGDIMDKAEIVKLREFLRRSFGAPTLQVAPNSKSAEAADVSLGERKLGTITVDDEDGDRSFAFAMKVAGRPSGDAGLSSPAVRERQADRRRAAQENRTRSSSTMAPIFSASSPPTIPTARPSPCKWRSWTSISTTRNKRSGSPHGRAASQSVVSSVKSSAGNGRMNSTAIPRSR